MQINITITVFRLLSFAKLSRKNRTAKNLRRSGEIAKSQMQRRSELFIAQNCACKGFAAQRGNREANIKHGTVTITAKNSAAKNFRRSGAIAKPKIKHKSATITAQKPRCKEFAAQRRNREVPNSMKVGIIYCAKLRCKEFAAQRRNRKANIKHRAATITAKKPL